jgi:uncharacterized iron-regulated membrane protein
MSRKLWKWHRWLGVVVLLPLLWWVGTGFIFVLWAIDHVRGRTYASGEKPPSASLPAALQLPPEALQNATSLMIRAVEGESIAIQDTKNGPTVWSLPDWKRLGSEIPAEWAKKIALRDFAPEAEIEELWVYDRAHKGRRIFPEATAEQPLPHEYAGPLPAYGAHFAHAGMHIYIDGLSGEIKARRTSIWRFYDFAFQLHSLEIISEEGDGAKRIIMIVVALLWMIVGGTGFWMWLRVTRRDS